ncbi:hypothetical protein [Rhizobium giardinii]|uniref:Uncharacterized protein n=1 Tax=Rhizobium giardinii TaxID=56731 RepID=A0A7W8X9V7_9HYPH|nr:hypothetical protein [Rhizobium giardinii]MBB5537604.1 hypothetical protein [Rhizobium giardinii]
MSHLRNFITGNLTAPVMRALGTSSGGLTSLSIRLSEMAASCAAATERKKWRATTKMNSRPTISAYRVSIEGGPDG